MSIKLREDIVLKRVYDRVDVQVICFSGRDVICASNETDIDEFGIFGDNLAADIFENN